MRRNCRAGHYYHLFIVFACLYPPVSEADILCWHRSNMPGVAFKPVADSGEQEGTCPGGRYPVRVLSEAARSQMPGCSADDTANRCWFSFMPPGSFSYVVDGVESPSDFEITRTGIINADGKCVSGDGRYSVTLGFYRLRVDEEGLQRLQPELENQAFINAIPYCPEELQWYDFTYPMAGQAGFDRDHETELHNLHLDTFIPGVRLFTPYTITSILTISAVAIYCSGPLRSYTRSTESVPSINIPWMQNALGDLE